MIHKHQMLTSSGVDYTVHDFFKALTIGLFATPHVFISMSCIIYLSEIKDFDQISDQWRELQQDRKSVV